MFGSHFCSRPLVILLTLATNIAVKVSIKLLMQSSKVSHVLASAPWSLGSKLVAQLMLDVPVLILLIIYCTDTEKFRFSKFHKIGLYTKPK